MPRPGAKKQAQRTKGNLRPSSSSEAAELLSSSGNGATGFIGFGATSSTPAYVPASETFDDVDSSLDPDFRIVLRKLSKRDSTTKIKALQEFCGLCLEKDEDMLKAVLPYWPRMYNKMSLDIDHRVRESSQQAMAALVVRVRRNLAPYLKNLMGVWLLSQCDTYPTVAASAQQAFQSIFPAAKQTDAMVFCKQEIVEYLVDNLVKQTPQTLSDSKSVEAEDMENKYNRVLTSSMLAMRKLLLSMPTEESETLKEPTQNLLNEEKFWKHGKSKVNGVKAGMCSFLAGLCQSFPEISAKYCYKMAPLIFHNIDEKDPVLISFLWEALLSMLNYVQDCWQHVNIIKAFWPKLRTLLENGFHGNMALIGPNLLPLISKTPQNLLGENSKFYLEFLEHFKTGLSSIQLLSSSSECNAAVTAYLECMQYVVRQLIKQEPVSSVSIQDILLDQLLPVLEASLVETKPALFQSPLYGMMGLILTNLEVIEGSALAAVSVFWTQFSSVIEEKLLTFDQNSKGESSFDERLIYLVKCLLYPRTTSKQKVEKVQFTIVTDKKDSGDSQNMASDITEKAVLGQGANCFVQKVTLLAFQHAHDHWSREHLRIFAQLVELNPSQEIIGEVIQKCHSKEQVKESASDYFVFEVCLPWLKRLQENIEIEGDLSHLIQVICVFIPVLENSAVCAVLEKLWQSLQSLASVHILLEKTFLLSRTQPPVKDWLRSPQLGQKLVTIATEVCQLTLDKMTGTEEKLQHGWDILTLVLSYSEFQEPVVQADFVQKILCTIQQCLLKLDTNPNCDGADRAVMFVARATYSFVSGFKSCLLTSSAVELLLTLFELSLGNQYHVTDVTLSEAKSAWSLGLCNTLQLTGGLITDDGILNKMVTVVQKHIAEVVTSIGSLEMLLDCVKLLLQTVAKNLHASEKSEINPVYTELTQKLLFTCPPQIPQRVIDYACVSGMYFNTAVCRDPSQFPTPTLFTSLYNVKLLQMPSLLPGDSTEGRAEPLLDWTEERMAVLLLAMLGNSVINYWIDTDTAIHTWTESVSELATDITKLTTQLDNTHKKQFWKNLFYRCADNPEFTLCVPYVLSLLHTYDEPVSLELSPLLDRCETLTNDRTYMLCQTLEYLAFPDRLSLLEIMVARLISTPVEKVTHFNGGLGALTVVNDAVKLLLHAYSTSVKDLMRATLDQILVWKEENPEFLLFACNMCGSGREELYMNAECARFFSQLVMYMPDKLDHKDWDILLCSMASWIQSIEDSQECLFERVPVQRLACCVCDLLGNVASCMMLRVHRNQSVYPANLWTEWNEFFSNSAFSILMPLFLSAHNVIKGRSNRGIYRTLLSCLGQAVSYCPEQKILDHNLPPYFVAGESSPLPDALQTLLNHFCPLLAASERAVQLTSYHLLKSVMCELPQYDREKLEVAAAEDGHGEVDINRSPPHTLMKVLQESAAFMDVPLEGLRIEDNFTVKPHSEEACSSLTYLLSWKLVLLFFKSAPDQLRQEYADYLHKDGIVARLMNHLFRLMPSNPSKMFQSPPALSITGEGCASEVAHLSCSIYQSVLETVPAMIRQWWKEQDRKTAAYVDKFTSKYVSHLLCTAEIQIVQKTDVKLDHMSIKARATTREVIATYAMEEVTIEMTITLPQNYPLGNITVQSEKRVGVSGPQWEKWLLQLNIFLQHQNGSIIDGLRLWKNNIDKRFEGVEDCMICFSVLHGTNFQLPRLQCKTCKKKFHSACLYKWFSTSHNCTCPLCRNLF